MTDSASEVDVTEPHISIADPLQWAELQQGRRSALVLHRRLGVRRGDVVTLGLDGQPPNLAIRRRVQFVEFPAPPQALMVIGFDWVDAGAIESVRLKVEEAMQGGHYRLEMTRDGRRLEQVERRSVLTSLFTEIRRAVGAERFDTLPAELLDQFCVQSLVKNHDTHGLLNSLINSFLIAYCVPETSGGAFDALRRVEALRAEVSRIRRRDLERAAKRAARAH